MPVSFFIRSLKLNPKLRGHCAFAQCNFFLKIESETLFNLSNSAKNERNFFLKIESETLFNLSNAAKNERNFFS